MAATVSLGVRSASLGPYSADVRGLRGIAVAGAAKGIEISGAGTWRTGGGYSRSMQIGAIRNNVEGNPSSPCLELTSNGFWSFRWVVPAGTREIWIDTKQASNNTARPSMIVKANAAIGVAADVTGTAAAGTGWVTIGPVTITPSSPGVIYVEFWNNTIHTDDPAYFDHIVSR